MDIEDTGASNIDEGSFQSHDRNSRSEGDMNFVAHKVKSLIY